MRTRPRRTTKPTAVRRGPLSPRAPVNPASARIANASPRARSRLRRARRARDVSATRDLCVPRPRCYPVNCRVAVLRHAATYVLVVASANGMANPVLPYTRGVTRDIAPCRAVARRFVHRRKSIVPRDGCSHPHIGVRGRASPSAFLACLTYNSR